MKKLFAIPVLLLALNSQASEYSLEKLDTLQTCASQAQVESAERALTFLENFKWWKMKNLYKSLHPDYEAWHASRVWLASVTPPEKVPNLNFGKGLVRKHGPNGKVDEKGSFIYDLAMIAYTNHVPRYILELNRVECVSSDTLIVSSVFSGVNVIRDGQGKAKYQTEINKVPTRFVIVLKQGLIYRLVTDLEDTTTLEMMKRLQELIKAGVPNIDPKLGVRDYTFPEILKEFTDQLK